VFILHIAADYFLRGGYDCASVSLLVRLSVCLVGELLRKSWKGIGLMTRNSQFDVECGLDLGP